MDALWTERVSARWAGAGREEELEVTVGAGVGVRYDEVTERTGRLGTVGAEEEAE